MRKIDTDETLVSKLRKGDEKAFDVIYERYWERLYSYAYRRLSPADMAYELTQDVFVSLWVRRDQLSIQVSLSGYLSGQCVTKSLNTLTEAM